MNAYDIYKYIEFIIFSLYLIFIFLLIQILFLWKDIDRRKLQIKDFINDSFFKKNFIYIFLFGLFFLVHEFFEGINLPNSMVFFEFLEMLALINLVLFARDWYAVLKTCAHKKSLPQELTNITKQ
ncbi:Uncharacterised protein [uncultured archaeon]|nr:Uncharacterised protein [uncultured archaeon]